MNKPDIEISLVTKNKLFFFYELIMAILALIVVAILFVELTRPITEKQAALLANIDLSILIIFAIDYFYRLIRAKNKWHFIKTNIFDLIAIMPFDKAFRIARLARLIRLSRLSRSTRVVRILRLTKLVRIFAYENRLMIYELIMAILALIVVAILFVEFTRPITEEQAELLANIDLSILVIFAIDYFYRLIRAKNKGHFFKSNIFDLIAIMPFDKAFRIARLARLVRLARMARFTKMIRLFAFARRFGNTFAGVLKTNGLIYMIIITFTIVIVGAFGILAFEPGMETFGDALWWSLVTTTTVGYGDISPDTSGGRILAGVLMIVGIGFLGMVTGSVATYFVDRLSQTKGKEIKSFNAEQIDFIKSQLDNLESMDQIDIDSLNDAIINIWKQVK